MEELSGGTFSQNFARSNSTCFFSNKKKPKTKNKNNKPKTQNKKQKKTTKNKKDNNKKNKKHKNKQTKLFGGTFWGNLVREMSGEPWEGDVGGTSGEPWAALFLRIS